MKIKKITIKNYRILKDFEIDLEDELSLVIGKNNCGKTSFLKVLDKFLNKSDKSKFEYEDFNLDFKGQLSKYISGKETISLAGQQIGIKLHLIIEYNENDNLANINKLMMDLNPDNNTIVLGFEYIVDESGLIQLKDAYNEFVVREKDKKEKDKDYTEKDIDCFLKEKQSEYFKTYRKSIEYDFDNSSVNEKVYIDLEKEKISLKDIINFKCINAKREVSNKEVDSTLSTQTSKIYKKSEESDEQKEAIEKFKDTIGDTDKILSGVYSKLFHDVIETVKKFGGIKEEDSIIEILSTLQHRELLEGNTTVMYNHGDGTLPEHYNGLGYMNLISMIFEIKIILQELKRSNDEMPADINLLFIEEPEAHTHPQMQYIFIKNIKSLLQEGIKRNDGQNRELQYIVSTHSSHIVAESDFDDIKYLQKNELNSVIAKNLKSLEIEYNESDEKDNFRFLKQYLTLNSAELFFADKAILIEGDTERILVPAMMKKIDIEEADEGIPLLSQNISLVEVGAHSQVFEKFIDFISVKTLIITDIDSYYIETTEVDGREKKEIKKCSAGDLKAESSSNSSLEYFLGTKVLSELLEKAIDNKTIRKDHEGKKWIVDKDGHLLVVYQTKENDYTARSFEDSFFHLNKQFLKDKKDDFPSLTNKWVNQYLDDECDVFEFAEKAISKKPALAIEILLNSNESFTNWEIPAYIKEGLSWLKKD